MVLFDEFKNRYPFSDNPRPEIDVPICSKPLNTAPVTKMTDIAHEDKKKLM